MRTNIIILWLIPILSFAQSDNEYFELALKKYQDRMIEIDTFANKFNMDSLLKIKIEDEDTLYYCDFSYKKKIEDLISLDLSRKTVISVDENWLDSNRIFIFGSKKYETKNDSLDLFLLYYEEGDFGISWVKYSKKPSTERVKYGSSRKLNKCKLPLVISIEYRGARLNISNYQYGLPAEIYYREFSRDFDSFHFNTEIRKFKLLKSYTFINLDDNLTVRIIHKGRKIKNYKVLHSENGNFNDISKNKPPRKLNHLY